MRAAYAVLREAIALIGRSALSVLFAQSGGKTRVAALISRRFSSAARVRIEASQSQRTTIRTKATMSAAALNVPRPIHLAMVSAVPLTTDERYGPCVRFATVIVPYGDETADMLGKFRFRDAEFAAVRYTEFSTDPLLEGTGFELPVRGCDESGFRSFCVALDCSRSA